LGVSRRGEFKKTITIFLQKVHVENFSPKNRQKFRCQFFLEFFVLSRFRVFLSDESSKTLQKTFTTKNVSKSFYKKFDQKSKTDFFLDFFYHVFGCFSVTGAQKHDKKNRKNKPDPIPFSYFDPPSHHGGPRLFFLPAPWALQFLLLEWARAVE
jgi:hypothetical protein